jgi:hypothetical protein
VVVFVGKLLFAALNVNLARNDEPKPFEVMNVE